MPICRALRGRDYVHVSHLRQLPPTAHYILMWRDQQNIVRCWKGSCCRWHKWASVQPHLSADTACDLATPLSVLVANPETNIDRYPLVVKLVNQTKVQMYRGIN